MNNVQNCDSYINIPSLNKSEIYEYVVTYLIECSQKERITWCSNEFSEIEVEAEHVLSRSRKREAVCSSILCRIWLLGPIARNHRISLSIYCYVTGIIHRFNMRHLTIIISTSVFHCCCYVMFTFWGPKLYLSSH
jgi:hypothetical protein